MSTATRVSSPLATKSRLFHTIIVIGAGLGTAACGLVATPEEASLARPDDPDASAADALAPDAIAAAFCDVPWPTTKGNNTVLTNPVPACVDPATACDKAKIDAVGPCIVIAANGCPRPDKSETRYPVCAGQSWTCEPGTWSQMVNPSGPCRCPGQHLGGRECKRVSDGGTEWLP